MQVSDPTYPDWVVSLEAVAAAPGVFEPLFDACDPDVCAEARGRQANARAAIVNQRKVFLHSIRFPLAHIYLANHASAKL